MDIRSLLVGAAGAAVLATLAVLIAAPSTPTPLPEVNTNVASVTLRNGAVLKFSSRQTFGGNVKEVKGNAVRISQRGGNGATWVSWTAVESWMPGYDAPGYGG